MKTLILGVGNPILTDDSVGICVANEIKKHIPDFVIGYKVDPIRQAIAESWPNNMDDSAAREEWGWKPEYDLATMTKDMLEKLSDKLKIEL